MEISVKVENVSKISRKLTVKVPAHIVSSRLERGLVEVQRTAKLKGFRPGHAPLTVIKQYYGDDVRHQVFHKLIDESYENAVREHQIRAIGSPKIDTPDHKTGDGAHDHTLHEDKDLTFIATVEIMPELEVKGYTGIALTREKADITDADVEKLTKGLLDSQAQLSPVSSGLVGADGKPSSRPAIKGDHADVAFSGGLVTDKGIEAQEGMKGSRVIELGSNSLIPGFEEEIVGMRAGETKTFRIHFPKDYGAADLSGKGAEFTVTVNELKEKKLPELNDEFAKDMGYESLSDYQKKAKEHLIKERTAEVDRKLRSDLLAALIEKNPFDCPQALIDAQTRGLANDWAQELKRQGFPEDAIQQALIQELAQLKTRAENQVRSSLILEAIGKKEAIEVKAEDFENDLKSTAKAMNVEEEKLRDFYTKNPDRKEDFLFRMRQDRVVNFLLEKAKIK